METHDSGSAAVDFAEDAAPEHVDVHGARVLIAGARASDTDALETLLRSQGYAFVSSTTDLRGLASLHRINRYHLIVLVLREPKAEVWAALDAVKAVEGGGYPPVLVIGARGMPAREALDRGARDGIGRPVDEAELLARARSLIEVRLLYEAARQQADALATLALHDPLTGLANRRLLADRVRVAIASARRNKRTVGIVYIDLDGFKDVNDRMGHYAGDVLLQQVATRLAEAVREEDTVARVGGDEFMLLLWNVNNVDGAATVVLKLIALVSEPYLIEGEQVRLTASAGVGLYPDHGEDAYTLIKSADAALYEAKRGGKNDYRISGFGEL